MTSWLIEDLILILNLTKYIQMKFNLDQHDLI